MRGTLDIIHYWLKTDQSQILMIFKNLKIRALESKIDHVMTLVFSAAQNRYKNRPWNVGISESGSDIVTRLGITSRKKTAYPCEIYISQ